MRQSIHDDTVELLLRSISQNGGSGLAAGFLFGKPGAPHWQKNLGIEIYYHPPTLTRAALLVRRHGPTYLKYLPIDDIWSMLQSFVAENFWYLADDVYLRQLSGSYADHASSIAKTRFAEALASSEIFTPNSKLTLFPLVPIQVQDAFESDPFFLAGPQELVMRRMLSDLDVSEIAPTRFPPIANWRGQTESPQSWLGIRSPASRAAVKIMTAILGAVALTPLARYRYLFSLRPTFGGYCTIDEMGITTTLGNSAHTPGLMHDILLNEQDHGWLAILATKLISNEKSIRRQIRALEYYYRAWESEPSERFPTLCMALDGLFGEVSHATQAVIDGIREVLGPHLRDARLRDLMNLRAAVIHGAAPDVYDSRKYTRYYDEYEADPIHDLELVVTACLRQRLFGKAFREQFDPNAELIAQAQAIGRLPKKLTRSSILEDNGDGNP